MAKRHDRDEWLARVREWKQSGLACGAFAKRKKINPRSLSWWAWRLRKDGESLGGTERRKKRAKRQARKATALELPFVELTAAGSAKVIELQVGELTVRLPVDVERETLVRVLEVIGRRG